MISTLVSRGIAFRIVKLGAAAELGVPAFDISDYDIILTTATVTSGGSIVEMELVH
jgi:hypothetical protein